MDLKRSNTEGNLKAAFAGESQANRRYLYFAQQADIGRITREASNGATYCPRSHKHEGELL